MVGTRRVGSVHCLGRFEHGCLVVALIYDDGCCRGKEDPSFYCAVLLLLLSLFVQSICRFVWFMILVIASMFIALLQTLEDMQT